MAFLHGKDAGVFVAEFDLSGDFTQYTPSYSVATSDITTMGNTAHIYLAGTTTATLNVQGVFNAATDKSDEEFTAALGNELVVTASPTAATSIGDDADMVNGFIESYSPRSPGNDAVRFSTTMQGSGVATGGKILHQNNQESSTSSGYASVRAVAQAASASGAVGHIHVTEFSGTDATITIEDSSDDIAFGSLVAFAQATGLTSERVSVTGEVLEYVRVSLAGTFTTVTFVVGFARFLP